MRDSLSRDSFAAPPPRGAAHDFAHEICLATRNAELSWELQQKIFPLLPRLKVVSPRDEAELAALLQRHQIKALFLDPDWLSGELSEVESQPHAALIIVSTHTRAAVAAFRAGAIDYLPSPINPSHLKESLARAGLLALSRGNQHPLRRKDDRLPVAVGKTMRPTLVREIMVFTSLGNSSKAVTAEYQGVVSRPIKTLEDQLDMQLFFRCNRAQIINLRMVLCCEPLNDGRILLRMKQGDSVLVSRRRAREFRILTGWKESGGDETP